MGHDERLRSILHGGFDCRFNIVGAVDAKDHYSPSSLSGGFLKRFSRSFRPWVSTIPKHGGTPQIWKELTEHFNLLRAYLSDLIACSSDVPARTGQATYQTGSDHIRHCCNDDRDGLGGILGRGRPRHTVSDDYIDIQADEFSGKFGEFLGFAF